MKIQNFKSANLKKRLKQILFSAVVFLSFIKVNAADYYWVGGTGNWNDFANHWSTTSGGTSFYTSMPTPNDDVYFDANSFSATGQEVTVNTLLVFCKNMDWSNALFNPTFSLPTISSTPELKIYGSLKLGYGMAFSGGQLTFESTSQGNVIVSNGVSIGSSLNFEGINGSWSLIGDFAANGVWFFNNTSFYSNNYNLYAGWFGWESSDTLDLGTSEIISGNLEVDSTGTVIASQTTIHTNYLTSSNHTFNNVECVDNLNCTNCIFNDVIVQEINGTGSIYHDAVFIDNNQVLSGPNTFHKATFNFCPGSSPVLLGGGSTFDTLFFNNPNQTIRVLGTININSEFITNAQASWPINIQSYWPGTPAYINKSTGIVCLNYLYLTDMNAIGGATFYAGANSIDLGNNSGWNFSSCSPAPSSNVWPGDANYDLTANNNDVLNIGLAYGETGPARAGASNAWVAQPATDWSSFFQSAVNKKHADCDGNGVVDNNDTLAISLNYGLTHPARLANPNSNLSISSPQLYLVANPDTVMEGDTVEVDIYLGTQAIPVDSIYGIAFTINFDIALVDTSWMPFDFTGSWMGTPSVDLLPFDHKLFSEGKADVALTRTDHTNASGYGYIGKMGAVIVDNVGTRLTTAPPYVTLPLSLSNVTALTATEFYLTISTGIENIEIDTLGTTGIHQFHIDMPFSVYPNPVRNKLNVFSYWLNGQTNCTVELYNVIGEKVISKQVPVSQNRFSVDVSALPQDIYFIKVITAKGTVNKKIVVTKN